MTQRDFYNAIVNAEVADELKDFAVEAIAKLDARNAKRASKPSKKALENMDIKNGIEQFILTNGKSLASEVAKGLGISTSKASALCRQMVEGGVLKVEDVKVKGKGTQKSYSLA